MVSTKRERRKWALEMAGALLRSDMDCFDPEPAEDEDEAEKYRAEIREIADDLIRKAERMK